MRTIGVLVVLLGAVGCGRLCVPKSDFPVADFCVPDGGAPAGQALTLMARENCGGCGTSVDRCEVTVSGNQIQLALSGESCSMPPGTACTLECRIGTYSCPVPALAAGQYTVKGGTAANQILVVADGGTTSCAVPSL